MSEFWKAACSVLFGELISLARSAALALCRAVWSGNRWCCPERIGGASLCWQEQQSQPAPVLASGRPGRVVQESLGPAGVSGHSSGVARTRPVWPIRSRGRTAAALRALRKTARSAEGRPRLYGHPVWLTENVGRTNRGCSRFPKS
jgi:hypothetical protein